MYPVLFTIGRFPVHSWGVMLMLGFALALWRCVRNRDRYGLSYEAILDVAVFGLIGGVIGGRLVYVALNWGPHLDSLGQPVNYWFSNHLADIPAVWNGGMTSFGGFGGGLIAGILACRARKVNVGDMCDLMAVSFPIGYGIGRIGCFLNGCCYGDECTLPWAVKFKWDDQVYRWSHPAQLYSVAAAIVMYLLLLPLERGRKFRGQLMLAFLAMYGIYRFLIEFVREGATGSKTAILGMTQAQIASLIISVVCLAFYAYLASRSRVEPRAVPPTTPPLPAA